MTDRFVTWDEYVDNFGAEMRVAEDVYQGMVSSGLKDWDTVSMDFDFVSDRPEKLLQLRACLETRYGYTVGAPVQVDGSWEISGKTPPMPITADSLMYWALDLVLRGSPRALSLRRGRSEWAPSSTSRPRCDVTVGNAINAGGTKRRSAPPGLDCPGRC
jgi:hypothetical protein